MEGVTVDKRLWPWDRAQVVKSRRVGWLESRSGWAASREGGRLGLASVVELWRAWMTVSVQAQKVASVNFEVGGRAEPQG